MMARKPLVRLDEHSTSAKIRSLVERAAGGETVAVVSDAGTPGISDPGAMLVDAAYEAGVEVDSIPGASAVSNALALSGFFAQKFAFLGFLPRRASALREEFEPYADSTTTLVFFEAPARVGKSLQAALAALGDRRVAICREMTKIHQQVVRGRLSTISSTELSSKGEFTIVLEGKRRGTNSA
jgi:16S rRNA (cytidine1402-2'-O)-methyltransferase